MCGKDTKQEKSAMGHWVCLECGAIVDEQRSRAGNAGHRAWLMARREQEARGK